MQGCSVVELFFPNSWDCAQTMAQEGTVLPEARLTRAGVGGAGSGEKDHFPFPL